MMTMNIANITNNKSNKNDINFKAGLELRQFSDNTTTPWFVNNLSVYVRDIVNESGNIVVSEIVRKGKKGNFCRVILSYIEKGHKKPMYKQIFDGILPANNIENSAEKFVCKELVNFCRKINKPNIDING